jgi:hypothetical protein
VEDGYSLLHHCPSAWNNAAPTGRIIMKCDILGFFENMLRKFKFRTSLTEITGTLHEVLYRFMLSRAVHLRMRNVLEESCMENQNPHFMFNNVFLKIVPFMI